MSDHKEQYDAGRLATTSGEPPKHFGSPWIDPMRGTLRLHERGAHFTPKNPNYHGGPDAQPGWQRKRSPHRAYVIGLHNQFLGYPNGHSRESIRGIIEATPSSYIFRTWESLIIRIRPGASNDTDWAEELPAA